ncbi:hypothetical protein CEXT_706381 [Caerostris extrusa]|uniref:Uncharacterized protein n=1 Tax=Caerostris extrusa TaxID=172846 RepID=A0AAV4QB66_CAEEX|nr:hypothetical protein CEXT_706381 [Caerostris extrusa]
MAFRRSSLQGLPFIAGVPEGWLGGALSLTGRNLYGNAAVSDGQKDDRGGIFVSGHLLQGRGKKNCFRRTIWGS